MIIRGLVLGATLLFVTTFVFAQFDPNEISKRLGSGTRGELSDSKIGSGLKQALQVGAENAVKLTARPDGYFSNEAIKIVMPKNLQPVEKGLRAVGEGPKVDAFVLSMNRAAENAARPKRSLATPSWR